MRIGKGRVPALLVAVLLFAVLLSGCFAEETPMGERTETQIAWQSIALAVVMLSFLMGAVAYAVGVGFNMPKLKAWAKDEFFQTLATAIIAGGLFMVIPSINLLITSLTIGASSCMPQNNGDVKTQIETEHVPASFAVATCFLYEQMSVLKTTYVMLGVVNFSSALYINMGWYLAPMQLGISFAPFSGLTSINDYIGMIMNFAGVAIVALYANIIMLEFLERSLMGLFPVGLALRAFPFTRSAGGALIALCIGFYVVYPLLAAASTAVCEANLQEIETERCVLGGIVPEPEASMEFQSIDTSELDCFDFFIMRISYKAFIVGVFVPFFNITLTFAFMRHFATLVGSEIDISALGKMI